MDKGIDTIMIQCTKCNEHYLTIYKSGDSKCPICAHINKLVVGIDAVNMLNNGIKLNGDE